MIIGYNFFGKDFHGNVFDTAIPTSELDEVVMGAGIYDHLFVSVDSSIGAEDEKLDGWRIKDIMNAKFQDNLEAGNIGANGHVVTRIQIYRRAINTGDSNWLLLGDFPYDNAYNLYSFVDRLAENEVTYEYAIVPIANEVIGDVTVSPPVKVNFEGIWISDLENNYQLEYDFNLDDVTHNRNVSKTEPINGRYPIVTFGAQNYRSGSVSFLPLSDQQIDSGGMGVDGKTERLTREKVIEFLNKGTAKVIRNDNGSTMVVVTDSVSETSKQGQLVDISSLKFSYTEIGELDYDTMSKGGLVGEAVKSKYIFDENGNVVWTMGARGGGTSFPTRTTPRPRNSFGRIE